MNDSNPLSTYLFESTQVRVQVIGGNPWFVAADVCKALDHSNPSQAVNRLDIDERGIISSDTPSGVQQLIIIN